MNQYEIKQMINIVSNNIKYTLEQKDKEENPNSKFKNFDYIDTCIRINETDISYVKKIKKGEKYGKN